MTYLNLNTIKKHLNLDDDFTEDDAYITSLADVAEAIVSKHVEYDLSQLAEENGGVLPPPILHACLLFIGNLYMNRESVSAVSLHNIPMSYEYLIGLYKNYTNFQG